MSDVVLYTVNEVADLIKVKPLTIYKWINDQKLPHYKIGGVIRIKFDDLENFLEESYKEVK